LWQSQIYTESLTIGRIEFRNAEHQLGEGCSFRCAPFTPPKLGVKYLGERRRMTKEEFEIGEDFYTTTGKWRCTDIGTRVIVAIHLNQNDSRNYNGPPYSIPENVFDEYDMEGCSLEPTDFEDKK